MSGWMPAPTLPRRTAEECIVLPKIATRPQVGEKVTCETGVGGSSVSEASKPAAENVNFPNIYQPFEQEVPSQTYQNRKEKIGKVRFQKKHLESERNFEERSPKSELRNEKVMAKALAWEQKGRESLFRLEKMSQAARSTKTPIKDTGHEQSPSYPLWYLMLVENSIQIGSAGFHKQPRWIIRQLQQTFSVELRDMYDDWDQEMRKGKTCNPPKNSLSNDFQAAGADPERRRSFEAAKGYLEKHLFVTHTFLYVRFSSYFTTC